MTIYDKNLESIKNNIKYTYMYKFIDRLLTTENRNQIKCIQSIDAKECGKVLSIKKLNKTYRLGSSFNPILEAKKWAEQFKLNDIGIVISMFGFGNGTMPRELINRIKDEEKIIIYEPSKEIFLYVLNNYDITDLLEDKRVYLVIEELNDEDYYRILTHNVDENNVHSQVFCSHPKYEELFPDSLILFKNNIRRVKGNARVNENTKSYMAGVSTYNIINNIRFINKNNTLYELIKFFITYRDIPVIIVSAGPSLDKNIDDLKKAKGKAVIISVDTAIETLLKKDIVPDFTITMDASNPPEAYDDERALYIPIIIRGESNYNITKKHIRQKFFVSTHAYYNSLYSKLGKRSPQLSSGGSVSTVAFSLCLSIGFKSIILVGQDLSYVDGFTHAGAKALNNTYNDTDNLYVEGIYGDLVKTRNDWNQYLIWFNNAVDVAKFNGCQVIDATEGGAKIKGTDIMTLREAIDLYCNKEIDVSNIVNGLSDESDNSELEIIKEYIIKSISDLNIIKQKSKESIVICNKLLELFEQDIKNDIIREYDNKLVENNQIMNNCFVNHLLDEYITTGVRRVMATIYKIDEDVKTEKIKTYNISIKIYEANIKGVEDLKVVFNELLEDL